MKTVVIIQARMTSSRLPGKMMMELGGKPVLQHVIERCRKIANTTIWCTFPGSASSAPLRGVAEKLNVPVCYGPEDNVLARYHSTAMEAGADVILRVTGDCPLVIPEVCEKVAALRLRELAHYASNVWPRSFPRGLDVECFTMQALHAACLSATDSHDLEHVTPWIIRNYPRTNYPSGYFHLARHNWSLDTIEDLQHLRKIFALGAPETMDDVLRIAQKVEIAA